MISKPVLFLDRDGTINFDPGYISNPKNLRILYKVRQGIIQFRRAGYRIIVVSNQSGIGRGYLNREDLANIHKRLDQKLAMAKPDAYYFCPHHPNDHCSCRKPHTKNFLQAVADWHLHLEGSLIIGDSAADWLAGEALNINRFLVRTGYGEQSYKKLQSMGKEPKIFDNILQIFDYFVLHNGKK